MELIEIPDDEDPELYWQESIGRMSGYISNKKQIINDQKQKIQKLVNPSLQSKIEKLIEEINDTNEKTHNIFEKQEGLMKTSQSFSLSTSKLRKIAYEYEFVNKELTMLIEKYNAQSDANIKRMDELLTLYKEIPKQFKSAQKIIQPKFEYELTILGNKK